MQYLGQAYIQKEEYEKASEIYNRIVLIKPESELNIEKTLSAIEYLKYNNGRENSMTKFTGNFRYEASEMIDFRSLVNGKIYSRAENQGGLFEYLAGNNILKNGLSGKGYQSELIQDDESNVYALKTIESYKEKEIIFYLWKQDSLIWKAERLLRTKLYGEAYDVYVEAIKQNPKHYYLYQHLEHLEYLRNRSEEEVRENQFRMVGDYGEAKIWLEKGLLYYKRPGQARKILRPITENRFMTLNSYKYNYEFEEEGGKIKGIKLYVHDFETNEWNLSSTWYYERTELLD